MIGDRWGRSLSFVEGFYLILGVCLIVFGLLIAAFPALLVALIAGSFITAGVLMLAPAYRARRFAASLARDPYDFDPFTR